MKLVAFRQALKPSVVFSLTDIKQLWPDFSYRQLSRWQQRQEIENIRRGYWRFTDQSLNQYIFFAIANKIYSPSYVSMESALSVYDLIPEGVFMTTSISSKKAVCLNTPIGHFKYNQLHPKLFWGYKTIRFQGQIIKLAEIEKTILDYLYFKPHLKTPADFESLRFEEEVLAESFKSDKFRAYCWRYGNKALSQRAEVFLATYLEQ